MADNSSSCYTDFGCFTKGLSFIRQKIIQHAVQVSDWPPPEVIFGSKSPYEFRSEEYLESPEIINRKLSGQHPSLLNIQRSVKRRKLKLKSSRTGGLTCVGSADMSTIVAGFVEFERSFNRMSLTNVKSPKLEMLPNFPDISGMGKHHRKTRRIFGSENDVYRLTKADITVVDPQILGHAIELCLKKRNKIDK